MKTPITPEALIELGFKKGKTYYVLLMKHTFIEFDIEDSNVTIGRRFTNATTIEDIENLIRLFK